MTLSLKLMNSFRGNFLKTKANMNRNENSIKEEKIYAEKNDADK